MPPDYRHPRALDAVAGTPPSVTYAGSSRYPVRDGVVVGLTERDAEALAAEYGVAVADLTTEGDTDDAVETCDTVKADGDVCGRELPCPYHSD